MRRIQIVILIFLVLSIFGCFNKSFIKTSKEPQKLLFYATINDSLKIFTNDSNWVENAPCIELKIDTVNTSEIKRYKKNDLLFEYKSHRYNKTQLFSLSEYEHIKKYSIQSFSFGSPIINTYINPHYYEENCFNNDHLKKRYKAYFAKFIEYKMTYGRIYIDVTVISDNGDKMILNCIILTLLNN